MHNFSYDCEAKVAASADPQLVAHGDGGGHVTQLSADHEPLRHHELITNGLSAGCGRGGEDLVNGVLVASWAEPIDGVVREGERHRERGIDAVDLAS
jgi:hypothetical protein